MCLQQFIQCQYYINIHIMNKDQVLYQLVEKQFNRQREMFEFETVEIIINKVPKSRIIKENTQLIFDQIKHSVQNSISKQQFRRVKKIEENKMIKAINFKLSKAITQTIIDNQQLITKQKLRSKFGIQKSLRYLKHQEGLKLEARLGQPKSSYSQVQYVKISNNDRFQHTKIFMREAEIRNLDIDFKNDYVLEFKNNLLPNEFQITKRAQVLAKLYLLDLYKNQVPNMENQLKLQEQQRLKQHQLQKIKKKVEEEIQVNSALKQQQVNDNDLMKQVKKIESLLQKKMNNLAYENFNNKKFEQSVLVKKSLEKLKKMVKEIPLAVNKLKFLIKYKQDKNY